MYLEVENLSQIYGEAEVLKSISFTADEGEFLTLIGPSGAGKTTLLKILAGLESPSSGSFRFSGAEGRPPVVMVFQDYLLFPYLTVFENVAFGLRARRFPDKLVKEKCAKLLDHFGLSERAKAYPSRISGGEKQRTALARALAVEPGVLLLDEPLANLDKNLKMETALYIRKIQKEFRTTMICVTHDQEEAMAVSDRIGILISGKLEQIDVPEEVYFNPVSDAAGRFMGPLNILPSYLFPQYSNGREYLYLRSEHVEIEPADNGRFRAGDVRFTGLYTICILEDFENSFEIYTHSRIHLKHGDRVNLKITDKMSGVRRQNQ